MKVIYFNTLYNKEIEIRDIDSIQFKDNAIVFNEYRIELEYVRKIEKEEE